MDDRPERAVTAVQVPMSSGGGMSPAMGVAAPVGAVSRKDRQRATRTCVRRDGTSGLLLLTALPGSASLQRRGAAGAWETLHRQPTSRLGRTRLELPADASGSPATFRVVFSPRNANLTAWISEDLPG